MDRPRDISENDLAAERYLNARKLDERKRRRWHEGIFACGDAKPRAPVSAAWRFSMAERSVVVLSGVRTAIGTYGGSLKDVPPTQLGALVVRESVKRAGVQPSDVGHVVFGN